MLLNAYCTLRDPPALGFQHQLRGRRDRSDAQLVPHLKGFMGYVTDRGKRPMTAVRYGVLRHLERVQHHLALEIAPTQTNAFMAWAEQANAVVFFEDGSVRSPDGKVLVAAGTGDAEPGAHLPFPGSAISRKQATEALLTSRGIRTPASLPPVVAEPEVDLRSASEVARRMFALFACAHRGQSMESEAPISVADLERSMPLAFASMTPDERAFMAEAGPSDQAIIDHAWRYESVLALGWTIGIFATLGFPDDICDFAAIRDKLQSLDAERTVQQSKLREPGPILDALDLAFRLHWAITEAKAKGTEPPEGVEAGAVLERHHAFNWLTRFEDADWDDVTTPT